MPNYYCKYCGSRYPSVKALTAGACAQHPNGQNRGNHVLYEGGEKSEYVCKYCGMKYTNLRAMLFSTCARHPDGPHKGKHSPAL